MSKILILCRHDERPTYDQVDTYAAGMNLITTQNTYSYGELEKLVFSYDGTTLHVYLNGTDIQEYDQLFLIGWFKSKLLEDIALSVATYMNFHGKPVRNSEVLFTRSRSKLSQYVIAALNDITLTPFLFCKDKDIYAEAFDLYWTSGYPMIMKGVQASRGDNNYLVKDEATLQSTLQLIDESNNLWFITQSFVPNNGDYRIIVMGDEVKYVIHRLSQQDSHLNNTSKGGLASEIPVTELPHKVQEQSVRLAKLLRREITGVDMIQHKETGEFYLLEINNMPQMATGSFVEKKLMMLDTYFSDIS
jgi:glutathione synthase/RimK-type ligase-like ATP-grasp enzyme